MSPSTRRAERPNQTCAGRPPELDILITGADGTPAGTG